MTVKQSQLVYKTVGEVELELHVFEPERRATTVPAMVFFFGGGWTGGTPTQFYPHCEYLASRGMVAISAEYRVRDRHGVSPFECVADGRSAIRWVREHAVELGIDPDRIAAGGGSAGGHVALCTATIAEPGDDSRGSCPNALVLFNPVTDTTREWIATRMPEGHAQELSPIHHVRARLPPTIIFHGTADQVVPLADVERFYAEMARAGNVCQLVPFEGKEHAFFNYGRDENVPFKETVHAADRFLASLGYLEGEPTL